MNNCECVQIIMNALLYFADTELYFQISKIGFFPLSFSFLQARSHITIHVYYEDTSDMFGAEIEIFIAAMSFSPPPWRSLSSVNFASISLRTCIQHIEHPMKWYEYNFSKICDAELCWCLQDQATPFSSVYHHISFSPGNDKSHICEDYM